ncbi:MAG: helix-turn-helix domain-containing protein [Planctomycetota bacterium]|nr:helix-turn-helix domain-containing protein [Planctomycetota bacterium]
MAGAARAEDLLVGLGFTALEASVYRTLLESAPATGYRVAQLLGKPISNTYKAIESLVAKGAVLVDDSAHRQCRPVAPGELLRRIERTFHERCALAVETLEQLSQPAPDDRLYALRSRSQVFERARSMIEGARGLVLADLFPGPADELRESLRAAAERGVRVGALVYERFNEPTVAQVRIGPAAWTSLWPGEQIVLVVDGLQHLAAVVDRGGPGVVQALWSSSLILALSQHDGLMSQMVAHELDALLSEGADVDRIRERREALRAFSVVHTEGFEKLLSSGSEKVGTSGVPATPASRRDGGRRPAAPRSGRGTIGENH